MFTFEWQVATNGDKKFLTSSVPLMNCYILHDIGRWFSDGAGGWRAWEHQQLWFIWSLLQMHFGDTMPHRYHWVIGKGDVVAARAALLNALQPRGIHGHATATYSWVGYCVFGHTTHLTLAYYTIVGINTEYVFTAAVDNLNMCVSV